MAYLGNNLQVAYQSYKIIDDISGSFNSSLTSFALQVGGVTPVPFPINPQQCLISVNGVVQEPDPTGTSGFNLVGSNIVFASAPTTGHSFFGVILAGADYVNVGVNYPSGSESAPSITFDTDLDTGIYNPADNELGLVTNSNDAIRINSSGDVTISSDLTVDTNTLYVDSANDRVGIGTTSPSYTFDVNGSIYATSYVGLPGATTSASGIVQLSDSTSSTSTTTAATPNAVKSAYDLANAALPASGGTMTGDVVFSATQTFTGVGIDLDGPFEQASEAVAALDVDCSAGNYFTKAISSNSTFTFSNVPTSGTAYSFTLEVDVTGTSTAITWPASVEWPADTAPSLTDTKTHLFMFVTNDGGTTWRGAALVDYTT